MTLKPVLRIDQETGDGEFKRKGIHCFASCGYDCAERVRLQLIEHFTQLAEDHGLVLEGWHLRVWHNGGWHACMKHEESGFMLQDHSVEGGIKKLHRNSQINPDRRFACYNYDTPPGTTQVWEYAATPWEAIGKAIRVMQSRIVGYRGNIGKLCPHDVNHARAALLYGETPAPGADMERVMTTPPEWATPPADQD